ncbi:MAG: SusC/RagA family TonB-linked outer membrane protein [Gemmatimonadales bacterium]
MNRMWLSGVIGLIATAGSQPPSMAAAQAGAIAGTVVDERSSAVTGARVAIDGSTLAAVTDIRGRFRLENVPGSAVTLRVTMIGFRPASVSARVGDQAVQIRLTPTVVELGEVVVTGTAGGEERRSIGNSVAKIAVSDIQQIAPVPDISNLLNARAPGVLYQQSQGAVGSGGRIRIRGASSLSLNNEPLLYIDGVRVDNATARGFDWSSTSRLNDINPNTIESIEVIKGPAAATLYGTEASNGVIQIITKKGAQGRAQVAFTSSVGSNWVADAEGKFDKTVSYYRDTDGSVKSFNLVRAESERGTPLFRNGTLRRYGVEVSGGNQGVQYFIAGNYDNDDGVMDPNRLGKWGGRANVQATVTDNLSISFNGGYTSSRNQQSNHELTRGAWNPVPATRALPNRGFLVAPPEVLRQAFFQVEDLARFSSGVQVNHNPFSWLTHRLSLGVDEVNEQAETVTPRLPANLAQFLGPGAVLGSKFINKRELTTTTFDYSATATWQPTKAIGTKTSVGTQYYRRFTKLGQQTGTNFPAAGVTTISSAAVRSATETFIENVTLGVYVQEQLSFRDRFYLTAAVRADDNSAFGQDFDLVTYPKVSASWVLSDEPFWPFKFANTFRLRAAYGKSGQQPDAFASLRTYQPVPGPGGVAAVRPQFTGNPALGPERGAEVEAGFEAAFLDDRIGVDFTFYDKRTKDAILFRQVAPSLGFPGVQPVNIGEVQNRGFELSVSATPITARNLRWDVVFGISNNANKILDMAGIPDINAAPNQYHREGFPVAAYFEQVVVSADIVNGRPANLLCDGGRDGYQGGSPVSCATAPRVFLGRPSPKYEGSVNTTLQLFNRLTVTGLLDFKSGHNVFSADLAIQCTILRLCEPNVDPTTNPIAAGEMSTSRFGPYVTPKVSFAKLRNIAASYRVPENWARYIGASSAFVTLGMRNLATFTGYTRGPDPDISVVFTGSQYQPAFNQIPTPTEFLASIRLTF